MALDLETCACGCSLITSLMGDGRECTCGCDCCAEPLPEGKDEIAQLKTLRQAIDVRLRRLEVPAA